MDLGTKHRQRQTADICKQHLRAKYSDKLALVEDFIVEIEGPPKNSDVTRWAQFTDIKDIKNVLRRISWVEGRIFLVQNPSLVAEVEGVLNEKNALVLGV